MKAQSKLALVIATVIATGCKPDKRMDVDQVDGLVQIRKVERSATGQITALDLLVAGERPDLGILQNQDSLKVLSITGIECDTGNDCPPPIQEFPIIVLDLKNLRSLAFILEDVRNVPGNLSKSLPKLSYLDLSDNPSLALSNADDFEGIDTLNLNGCSLGDTDTTFLFSLKRVSILGLSSNGFSPHAQHRIRTVCHPTKVSF